MSWAFITTLNRDPQQSYIGVLQSTRGLLKDKYEQIPQLSVRLFILMEAQSLMLFCRSAATNMT